MRRPNDVWQPPGAARRRSSFRTVHGAGEVPDPAGVSGRLRRFRRSAAAGEISRNVLSYGGHSDRIIRVRFFNRVAASPRRFVAGPNAQSARTRLHRRLVLQPLPLAAAVYGAVESDHVRAVSAQSALRVSGGPGFLLSGRKALFQTARTVSGNLAGIPK